MNAGNSRNTVQYYPLGAEYAINVIIDDSGKTVHGVPGSGALRQEW